MLFHCLFYLIYVSDYFFGIFKPYLNLNIVMGTKIFILNAKNAHQFK